MNNNYSITLRVPLISTLLGVAFIVLKLCEAITWKWIWVVSPFWIPIGIWIVGFIVWLIIKVIQYIIETIQDNKRYKDTLGSYGSTVHWIPELKIMVDDTGHELGYKQEENS